MEDTIVHGKGLRAQAAGVLRLGLPMLGGMAFDTLYSLTDSFFAARVGGGPEAALAAIGAAGPLFFLMVALAQGIAAGVMVESASASGAAGGKGDRPALERIASTGSLVALVGGLLMGLAFAMAARPLLSFFGGAAAVGAILSEGTVYLLYIAPGLPCLFLGHALFSLRQGEGLTKRYGIAMAASTAANAILDPIFMLVLGMGIKGNALGTSLSQALFLLLAILAFRADEGSGAFTFQIKGASKDRARRILAIGLPQSLAFVAIGVAQAGANIILASRGPAALAAHTIAVRFEGIALVPCLAFASAACVLIAQARGAGGRGEDAWRGGLAVIGLGSAIVCGALAAFSLPLSSLIAGDAGLGAKAAVGARWLALGSAIGHASGIFGAQVLLGLGKPLKSLAVQVLRLILLPLPLAWLAGRIPFASAYWSGPASAWAGLALGLVVGGLASLAMARSALRSGSMAPGRNVNN
jgi:putative MATE family efflux protein